MFGGKIPDAVKDFLYIAAAIAGILALGFSALAILLPVQTFNALTQGELSTPQPVIVTSIVSPTADPNASAVVQ